MTLDIDFPSIFLITFGTCREGCATNDVNNPCPSCAARVKLEVRAMHQPAQSTILFPPALYGDHISATPQPFYIYVMYYMTIMDYIQLLSNPDVSMQFKTKHWHSSTRKARQRAKVMLAEKLPWMSTILNDMMNTAKTQVDVLRAYEQCIFMGMAILKEASNASTTGAASRVEEQYIKLMEAQGTKALIECPCEMYGQMKYDTLCSMNNFWNEDRNSLVEKGTFML